MIFPLSIIIVRLPLVSADWMLWVIIMVVRWFFADNAVRNGHNLFGGSRIQRAAVCSSSKSSLGGTMVLISSVSACLCPPDKRPTFVSIRSSSPIQIQPGRIGRNPVSSTHRHAKAPAPAAGIGQRQVFLNGHMGEPFLSSGPETGAQSWRTADAPARG